MAWGWLPVAYSVPGGGAWIMTPNLHVLSSSGPQIRVMLGQGCLRALSWRTIIFHLRWVYDAFFQRAEMGPKVVFFWGCKSG